jgi:hypothetical protein
VEKEISIRMLMQSGARFFQKHDIERARTVHFFMDQRSIALYLSMRGISASASDEELRDVLVSEAVASSPVI